MKFLNILKEGGIDVQITDKNGRNSVYWATIQNDFKLLQFLFQ